MTAGSTESLSRAGSAARRTRIRQAVAGRGYQSPFETFATFSPGAPVIAPGRTGRRTSLPTRPSPAHRRCLHHHGPRRVYPHRRSGESDGTPRRGKQRTRIEPDRVGWRPRPRWPGCRRLALAGERILPLRGAVAPPRRGAWPENALSRCAAVRTESPWLTGRPRRPSAAAPCARCRPPRRSRPPRE